MKALLFALPILITFAIGWFAHAWMVRRRPVLNKQERVQLEKREELVNKLTGLALSHAQSEPFAVIVLDEIHNNFNEITHAQIDVLHRKDPS